MKAKDITLGGIVVALSIVTLYFTNILPANTLALLGIASCFIPVVIMRSNIKTAIFVYLSTTIISFFLIPINYVLMYGMFFGIYGIVKYFIEKLNKMPLEIALKLVFFNIMLLLGIFVMNSFLGNLQINIPIWILFIAAQAIFLVYDYALTGIISFYLNRFHKLI